MTTRRLYYDDAFEREFTARVLSCELASAGHQTPDHHACLGRGPGPHGLLSTSGGQPHDMGKIGDANVLDVREEGDEIIHVVEPPPG